MANDKKSFLFYVDWGETFKALPDDKAGQLIKHLCAYVNDENPASEDILINAVFVNIKNTLKRDLDKWQGIREKRSEAGKASANKRQQKATSVESVEQTPTNPTVRATVSVTETVKGTVKVKGFLSELKKELKNSYTHINNLRKLYKLSEKEINERMEDFWLLNSETFDQEKTVNDARKHFGNWLKIQIATNTTTTKKQNTWD